MEFPNEALRMGYSILAHDLTKAFNLIFLRGEPIPAWAEGLMYLIYKGKGDKSDLNLLNDRLTHLVESRGVLGQIQNGGRKGRLGLDSLFVLRTILEKSASSTPDLSLLFIDLSKAFDKVPHDLLWDKLIKMGCHPKGSIQRLICNCISKWLAIRQNICEKWSKTRLSSLFASLQPVSI